MQAILTNASAEEGREFIVLGEPSRLVQLGEGSFHNSALGERLEDALLATLDHQHVPANRLSAHPAHPIGVPVSRYRQRWSSDLQSA